MRETIIESHYSTSVISRQMDNSNSPGLASPPDNKTPPLVVGKHAHTNVNVNAGFDKSASDPVDAGGLSRALRNVEDGGRLRERPPVGSPSRKRQRVQGAYGDRLDS